MCKCNCETFKEHISGITFSTNLSTERKADAQMLRNHKAYKNLRNEGMQPASLSNAAEMEARASDPREIAEGKVMSKKKIMERNIVHQVMGESGMLPAKVSA